MNTTTITALDDKRLDSVVATQMGYSTDQTLFKLMGVNEVETTEKSVIDTDITGPKLMKRVSEAGLAPQSDIVQGFVSVIPWEEYNLNFSLTWDARKTDQKGSLMKEAKTHTDQIARTQDQVFGGIWRNSFDTGYIGADGKSLISGSHPLKSGGTMANTFTDSQKALTYSTLGEGETILNNRMKTHTGERIARKGNRKYTLLVGREQGIMMTAFDLVGGFNNLKPYSATGDASNDANFYEKWVGAKYNLIISDVLTLAVAQEMGETTAAYSSTATQYETMWFLVDESMLKAAFKKITLKDSNSIVRVTDERNLTQVFDTFSFFGFGYTSVAPFAIFGSKGDGSATNF